MARKPTTLEDTLRPAFEGIGGVDVDMPEDGERCIWTRWT